LKSNLTHIGFGQGSEHARHDTDNRARSEGVFGHKLTPGEKKTSFMFNVVHSLCHSCVVSDCAGRTIKTGQGLSCTSHPLLYCDLCGFYARDIPVVFFICFAARSPIFRANNCFADNPRRLRLLV
jgi:hypothetical protein